MAQRQGGGAAQPQAGGPDEAAADDADIALPSPTVIVFKNIGPEEMMARCDPDRKGRTSWSACRAEAEMGTFFEQVNLLGAGGTAKKYENQGSYNELFDTGRASKLHRSSGLNYGKDIYGQWLAQ